MKTEKGFTLIEMLVVIGIIAILVAATTVGYSKVIATSENTRARELVSNVSTALQALYQNEGMWPKKILEGASGDFKLGREAGLALAKKGYLSLSMNSGKTELIGYDRFGVVTPWAVTVIKKRGTGVNEGTKIGAATLDDHILRYAVDDDGDGITEVPAIGDSSPARVRANACVWCCGRDGKMTKKEAIKSWTSGQEVQK